MIPIVPEPAAITQKASASGHLTISRDTLRTVDLKSIASVSTSSAFGCEPESMLKYAPAQQHAEVAQRHGSVDTAESPCLTVKDQDYLDSDMTTPAVLMTGALSPASSSTKDNCRTTIAFPQTQAANVTGSLRRTAGGTSGSRVHPLAEVTVTPVPSVPAAHPTLAVAVPHVPTASIPSSEIHLVFVDDDEANCRIGKRIVERLGYRVTVVRDGDEAIQVLLDCGQLCIDSLAGKHRISSALVLFAFCCALPCNTDST